ncbi:2Fe-2S iron-sulfur cluster-binding protein [Glutamicibacter halophytocola]|uniref:2Fe-2S iron-sulfur cluster-binding protein n=1 Tax=Glutamicibacter halophytocola TaxID=1933880 RepID=A0AA94XU80_9MICC|nr:2Fe-2S iron-sulfur cluster-binding protein [Glutamicibacter halophytocola]UUX57578.1 2Fe-2S iron-sulfur cluster-binding protein [Glutamicibacter halophytocola]
MRIDQMFRFPIKGLPGEPITSAPVEVGRGILGDRSVAFSNGTVEVADGEWNSCLSFTILKNNKSLQKWSVKSEPPFITVSAPREADGDALTFDSSHVDGRRELREYLSVHLPTQGPYRRDVISTPNGMFDSQLSGISIINPNTVRQLSKAGGIDLDPRRYRGNILVEGLPAFAEFGLIGKVLRIGDARIAIIKSIERCSATSVNPETTEVDTNGPRLLATHFGHLHCGIYGTVLTSGPLDVGSGIEVEEMREEESHLVPAKRSPRFATVLSTTAHSPEIVELTLSDPFGWFSEHDEAGKYLRVHLPDPLWRNYTITSVNDGTVKIAIKVQGDVSRRLAKLQAGDELLVSGPYGTMNAPNVLRRRTALVTAGIGITPAIGLLRDPKAASLVGELRLLHVERGRPSQLSVQVRELSSLVDANAEYQRFDSSERRPTRHEIAGIVDGCDSIVICGPEGFTREVHDLCLEQGILPEKIHGETFVSPQTDLAKLFQGLPAASVRCQSSGTEFIWKPEDGVLLDSLEAEGLDAPSLCRAGSCGQCAVKLLKGSVTYPMEPSAAVPAGQILTCVSVPAENVELDL